VITSSNRAADVDSISPLPFIDVEKVLPEEGGEEDSVCHLSQVDSLCQYLKLFTSISRQDIGGLSGFLLCWPLV
jgi:hypothetical protein